MISSYTVTLFLSAFLLFLVQPMVGKMVLPFYGGAPAVWSACMLFFQATLFLGYFYSHLSLKWLGLQRQTKLHIVLLLIPLVLLPIDITPRVSPPSSLIPVIWLLGRLFIIVGPPFFVVSSIAPLLQRWFSATNHPSANNPYFLYAASNFGSLLALLSYPILFEPVLNTTQQSFIWTFGYVLLTFMVLLCAAFLRHRHTSITKSESKIIRFKNSQPLPEPTRRRKLFWVFTSFVPSSLMLGVTVYITTNLAAIPLLWVLPLAIYLLSFMLVFSRNQILPHALVCRSMPIIIIALAPTFFMSLKVELLLIPLHLVMFFVVAMVCHGELASSRPNVHHLTEYYLWIAIGGAMGGVFNALIAPAIFNRVVEYPIVMILSCLILPAATNLKDTVKKRRADIILPLLLAGFNCLIIVSTHVIEFKNFTILFALLFAPAAIVCFSFKDRTIRFALTFAIILFSMAYFADLNTGNKIYASRNFYGVKQIIFEPEIGIRHLYHGTTVHGSQFTDPSNQDEPLAYYHKSGPIGDVFDAFGKSDTGFHAAIIGLGVGSIASYAKKGQHFTFYEIDPDVEQIARDTRYFNFLADMRGSFDVVIGDGRLKIANASNTLYGMIILDAFNSDAIPVHLLTKEALQLYLAKLKKDGILVFHISNRFIDLKPLLGNIASNFGLVCLVKSAQTKKDIKYKGKMPAEYVAMGLSGSPIDRLQNFPAWYKLDYRPDVPIWTDKYSNIISLLKR
jgi:hypothetical protein